MRIISGSYRGRKLNTLSGHDVRPTTDRIKVNIFNLIQSYSQNVVLDMFAGSGAMGIECLSRGAEFVGFCDVDKESVEIVKKNLHDMKGEYKIVNADFRSGIKNFGKKFDCIFIDPPYNTDFCKKALEEIKTHLAENFCIVVETSVDKEIEFDSEFYLLAKEKNYGITKVMVFTNN